MDGWIDGWMDKWINGWMDGSMDGWMDGWMDGQMYTYVTKNYVSPLYSIIEGLEYKYWQSSPIHSLTSHLYFPAALSFKFIVKESVPQPPPDTLKPFFCLIARQKYTK